MYIKKISNLYNSTSLIEGKVPYLKINKFDSCKDILAVFSTRLGGVSKGQFTSMNFCTPLGDSIENVRKNFELFSKATGLKNFVLSKQTHTTNVKKVSISDIEKGLYKEMDYDNVDGLVTNEKGITLSTFYADCVSLYFYDPVHSAIGLSHAGWRGTVNNMVKATLDKMNIEFSTNPRDVICAIGPSICVDCYEVSEDVAREFINAFDIKEIPKYSKDNNKINSYENRHIVYKKDNDKYMLNLWIANYTNMLKSGVLDENISFPDICTCENKEIMFTHRGLNGKRGNLGAFLMIKTENCN